MSDDEARAMLERYARGGLIEGPDDPRVQQLPEPLRDCVLVMPGGAVMVKHPWVNSMAPFVGEVTDLYEAKFSMARKYLSERDLTAYLHVVVERPWRLTILERWWSRGKLSRAEAAGLLLDAWADTEMPTDNLEDPAYLWRELGFATDDPEGWAALPDTLTVWRGGPTGGISWTLDRERAEWFAQRFTAGGGKRPLWQTTVPKAVALGYVNQRHEREVILDPDSVAWTRAPRPMAVPRGRGK